MFVFGFSFCNENNQPLNFFQGIGGFPVLDTLRFSCVGCRAILSRVCFCQESLDQMILEVSFQPGIL